MPVRDLVRTALATATVAATATVSSICWGGVSSAASAGPERRLAGGLDGAAPDGGADHHRDDLAGERTRGVARLPARGRGGGEVRQQGARRRGRPAPATRDLRDRRVARTILGCANQLLEKHPVAFVGETELGTAGSVPIIERAGVPLVGAAGVTPELVFSKDAFAFGLDAVGDWSGWTKFLTTAGKAKTINLLNLDIPAASVFEQVVRSVAKANGAKVGKVVSLPLDATDASAQMAAVAEGNPDVVMAVTSAQLCVPVAQAHESVAPGTKLFLPGICASPKTISAAGTAMNGAYVGSGALNPYDLHQPQVATYRNALNRYGKHVQLSQFAGNGFTAVMNLKALLDKSRRLGCQPGGDRRRAAQRPAHAVLHDRCLLLRPADRVLAHHLQQRSPRVQGRGPQAGRRVERVVRRHDAGEARLT